MEQGLSMSGHLNEILKIPKRMRISGHTMYVSLIVFLFSLVIPIFLGWWTGVPTDKVLALITSTLIFQAAAAIVGLGLGLHPLLIMVSMSSVAIASMITIFELSQILGDRSERMNLWIRNIQNRTGRLSFLRKYGSLMLVPTIWVPGIGLYGTPLVARIFGWDRRISVSILCMTLGWVVAMAFVMATTLQLLHLFF